ncbi:MAG: cobalt-precorrin 5A hydrolase [Eubacterium sp.]|nr:cobalt-precorrin 5A hydrolase [Eubacterium sp.]
MKIRILIFSDNGRKLAEKIKNSMPNDDISIIDENYKAAIQTTFTEGTVLFAVGAVGIAVRLIAPYIKSKTIDSPVLVADELGKYVIPILSGHLGGANEIALKICEAIGAEPVITTATDINGCFAADNFAKKYGFKIANPEKIKAVSSKSLKGEQIFISSPEKADILISFDEEEKTDALIFVPKIYALGIGIKKGKTYDEINSALYEFLERENIKKDAVFIISSIDKKKDEDGIKELSYRMRVPFVTYSAEELSALEGEFTSSEFVKETVGTDNVCERAALKAAGERGKLEVKKSAFGGITFALASRKIITEI